MPQTVNQFAKSLIDAGLATADEIKALWTALPTEQRPRDAEEFSRLLRQQGRLTEFQARELLSGSSMPLVLGDYVLLSRIGAGGMGQVFRAKHRVMDRLVAIKLLTPTLVREEEAVKRFQREVKAAARLSHPNIVRAYDASCDRGVWYLVMEHVDGRDLAQVVDSEGPLSIARAVDYVCQAARGLAYAHKNLVVHRDIKPANLLLDREGVVKILDMGLARFDECQATAQEGLTQSGQVMGTIDYMAPEQAADTRAADARADIYSLGCTLWRLLTGQNLFGGVSVVQKLLAHQTMQIPSLAAARPDAPIALQEAFERMVAKLPEERFQSMADLEAALVMLNRPASSSTAQTLNDVASDPQLSLGSCAGQQPKLDPLASATTAPRDELTKTVAIPAAQPPADRFPNGTFAWSPDPSQRAPRVRRRNNLLLTTAGGLVVALVLSLGIAAHVRDRPKSGVPPQTAPSPGETTTGRPRVSGKTGPEMRNGPPVRAVAPFNATEAGRHQQAWAKATGHLVEEEIALSAETRLTLVLIPPGEYFREEGKRRFPVRLTQPFYLGQSEVTQAQWQAVMGHNPSQFQHSPEQPVEYVSWNDVQEFLAKLNRGALAGDWKFQLPTEAQWEFACRAGTTTEYSFGDNVLDLPQFAWFNQSGGMTHRVGQLRPNPFGLYDMHGNVWEWCEDFGKDGYFSEAPIDDPRGPPLGDIRVPRGGGWNDNAGSCTSLARGGSAPEFRSFNLGFRLAAVRSRISGSAQGGADQRKDK